MPAGEILIDTNILAYVFDADVPEKRRKSREVLEKVKASSTGVVSSQNLAELFSVLTERLAKPLPKGQAAEAIAGFAEAPYIRKISYTHETVKQAAATSSNSGIHFWDALVAETMLENNVYTIYTENEKDFNKIRGIKAINPFK